MSDRPAARITLPRPFRPAPPGIRAYPKTPQPVVPTPDARFDLCRGTLAFVAYGTFDFTGHGPDLLLHTDMDADAFAATLPTYPAGRSWMEIHGRRLKPQQMFARYAAPISERARRAGVGGPFLLRAGDNVHPVDLPAFARSRPVPFAGLCNLQDLLRERMFGGLDEVAGSDVPWEEKEPRLVWRGASTGRVRHLPGQLNGSARFRIPWANDTRDGRPFDLGYTQLTPRALEDPLADQFRRHLKPHLAIAEQLRCRYLLSLEGNDVASGLRWMLASNSVVLAPRPTITGYAGEALLEPMKHYVPVRPDLSDLNERFDWCLRNDDRCREIADNGRLFVDAFLDMAAEDELSLRLVAEYFSRVTLRAAAGAELPAGVL